MASLLAQTVKHPTAMWETWVGTQGWEDPLEKEMATRSSILAWKIPWTEETGGLFSSWGHKELDMTESLTYTHDIIVDSNFFSSIKYILLENNSMRKWKGNSSPEKGGTMQKFLLKQRAYLFIV